MGLRTSLGLKKKQDDGAGAPFLAEDPGQRPKDLSLLRKMLADYDLYSVDNHLSPNETMPGPNYMWVGQSALESIMAAIAASNLSKMNRILDMPCGHGRILRHLRAAFPKATIEACDLDVDGVNFCAERFGAVPVVSKEDLTSVELNGYYDLIWIGSLFTHTSREITKSWLTFLASQLSEHGIIVATFHGRWKLDCHKLAPMVDDQKWSQIVHDYETTGYGFRDYGDQGSHDFIKGSYGISLAKATTLVDIVQSIPNVRLFMYQEQGWGNNHDVVAFGRP